MRNRYLIAYDIADDKRRDQVYTALMGSGDHVQFSVFLCALNDRELAELTGRLSQTINHADDQVIVLDMGAADSELFEKSQFRCIGKGYRPRARVLVI